MPPGQFIEVYLNAPLEVCEQRDPKGLYAKARAGKIKEFTGVTAPYEAPAKPEIELPTAQLPVRRVRGQDHRVPRHPGEIAATIAASI